jgi:phospholipase C
MVVVSPYTKPGYISHTYEDHASILKFIERNWHLQPLSTRGLDNLPNPVSSGSDRYVPTNRLAIGDMFSLFDFSHPQAAAARLPKARGGQRTGAKVRAVPNSER